MSCVWAGVTLRRASSRPNFGEHRKFRLPKMDGSAYISARTHLGAAELISSAHQRATHNLLGAVVCEAQTTTIHRRIPAFTTTTASQHPLIIVRYVRPPAVYVVLLEAGSPSLRSCTQNCLTLPTYGTPPPSLESNRHPLIRAQSSPHVATCSIQQCTAGSQLRCLPLPLQHQQAAQPSLVAVAWARTLARSAPRTGREPAPCPRPPTARTSSSSPWVRAWGAPPPAAWWCVAAARRAQESRNQRWHFIIYYSGHVWQLTAAAVTRYWYTSRQLLRVHQVKTTNSRA